MTEKLSGGEVLFYSRPKPGKRGFGFVKPHGDGPDVYISEEACDRNGVELYAGDLIEYSVKQNARGKIEIDTLAVVEVTK